MFISNFQPVFATFAASAFKTRFRVFCVFRGDPSCQEPLAPTPCRFPMMSKPSSLTLPRISITIALASLALLFTACGKKESVSTAAPAASAPASDAAGELDLSSDEQKLIYGIGYNIGSDLGQKVGFVIDQEAIKAGLTDALSASPSRITETELQAAMMAVQKKLMAAMEAEAKIKMAPGAEFLAKNKTREGVIETDSGLQYKIIKSGPEGGAKPKATDNVVVHYHGTLMDGSVFDSSVDRGEPAGFPVNQVIPGWTEALQLMSIGDTWKLWVPANIGYGPQSRPKIPPYSLLIFEVELIEIK